MMKMGDSHICKYSLYHDKPCVDGEPSSNNGWIYTAYAQSLGLKVDTAVLNFVFHSCFDHSKNLKPPIYIISRLPNKWSPPISRDEIIGMQSLGFKCFNPKPRKWFMYYPIALPNVFDYIKAAIELYKIKDKHRNYFWQTEKLEVYPLAMKLMWHDRYYINRMQGIDPTLIQFLTFQIYALSTILQKNISAKNVLWLQLSDLNSFFWIRFINQKKNFQNYFKKDHPFNNLDV